MAWLTDSFRLAAGWLRSLVSGEKARREREAWRRSREVTRKTTEEIRLFDELLRERGETSGIDDRTWVDLDLDLLFRRIDGCESSVGQQWLYARLRNPERNEAPLTRFDLLVRSLSAPGYDDSATRKRLSRLSRSYGLPLLFFGDLPDRPAAYLVFPALTLVAVAAAISCFFSNAAIFVLGAIGLINIVVRLVYRRRTFAVLHAIPSLRTLIRAGRDLSSAECGLPERLREEFHQRSSNLGALVRASSWLVLESAGPDEISHLLYEYVNLIFLLDVNALVFSLELLRDRRTEIRALFERIGEVDAALSVATFRRSLPSWCPPSFSSAPRGLRIDAATHPLLTKPVDNSLTIEERGVLVTGSNMTGKTTFLKTIGVNAVLAQTIFTCSARAYEAPFVVVMSAIGRSESLTEGTSYYLGEIRRVRELVVASDGGSVHLFLLDELFRGTNTIERIAAGKAVLSHLNRPPHLVFVSTHDIELVPLLEGSFVPCHFREALENGELSFDYKIRPGPSSTRNAIALLEGAAFPRDLVSEALETVDVLRKTNLLHEETMTILRRTGENPSSAT